MEIFRLWGLNFRFSVKNHRFFQIKFSPNCEVITLDFCKNLKAISIINQLQNQMALPKKISSHKGTKITQVGLFKDRNENRNFPKFNDFYVTIFVCFPENLRKQKRRTSLHLSQADHLHKNML